MDEDQETREETSSSSQNENQNRQEASSSRGNSAEEPRSNASRTRRLVSQPTFQEGSLDNSVLNSQQQFVDLDSDSDDEEEDPDQLFEDYMRETSETVRSQTLLFNDELPMEHTYLGQTDVVRGTNFYEPGKVYEIPLCDYHSMVFPGEIFPMITVADSVFARTPDSNEGLTFGLVFQDAITNDKVYGVTCQVFEKGVSSEGHITIKSKAHQRFELVELDLNHSIARSHCYRAKVKILPEYILPDPINLNISNNLMKFSQSSSHSQKIKTFLASSMYWPKFVYDQFSIVVVNEKIERYLAMLNISAPLDPTQKSFWLARNVPLNQSDRLKIFTSNCVNKRMLLIAESLNFMCFFNCKRCKTQIASYSDIFAMAKGNVNANYCNPAGYIHETLTVHKTSEDAERLVDRPSTEFSWFPGYAWQIAVCKQCSSHIGWKFSALSKHLKPKSFFGLSCKSLVVASDKTKNSGSEQVSDDSSSED